jgi:hypothetical protein
MFARDRKCKGFYGGLFLSYSHGLKAIVFEKEDEEDVEIVPMAQAVYAIFTMGYRIPFCRHFGRVFIELGAGPVIAYYEVSGAGYLAVGVQYDFLKQRYKF